MERVKGIEPSSQPWEGHILPLNHTRLRWNRQRCRLAPPLLSDCRRGWQLVCRVRPAPPILPMAARSRPADSAPAVPVRTNFSAVHVADIKTVHRRAALGHDARGGNVQIAVRQTSAKSRRAVPAGLRSRFQSGCGRRRRRCRNGSACRCVRRDRPNRPDARCRLPRDERCANRPVSPVSTASSRSENFSRCSRSARLPVRPSFTKKVSSAMPSARVKICAPRMFRPAALNEPAILPNSPARSQVQTFTRL